MTTPLNENNVPGHTLATGLGGMGLPPVRVTEPFTAVVFGATGDLTARKLVPALFRLWEGVSFNAPFAVLGIGRRVCESSVPVTGDLRHRLFTRSPTALPKGLLL